MDDSEARLWFDYVDPVSFLVELRLRRVEARVGAPVARRGWEIAPPPAPPPDVSGPAWSGRWRAVARAAEEEGLELAPPRRIPWSRKAHELALHAAGAGAFEAVHDALFRAYHLEGRDIGRIDVLTELATACGLDRGEVRTVLGVDRWVPEVLEGREAAERLGLRGVPTLARGDTRLEGLADEDAIAGLLGRGSGTERAD
ncbi:MAG TPA: DsbA family protein [Longimicrobiales bacterium]|nr:DsbA family protein [Longimicrobiales bacterium]